MARHKEAWMLVTAIVKELDVIVHCAVPHIPDDAVLPHENSLWAYRPGEVFWAGHPRVEAAAMQALFHEVVHAAVARSPCAPAFQNPEEEWEFGMIPYEQLWLAHFSRAARTSTMRMAILSALDYGEAGRIPVSPCQVATRLHWGELALAFAQLHGLPLPPDSNSRREDHLGVDVLRRPTLG